MRKLITVSVVVLCFASLTATAQNDPKAKAVLDAVSKKVNGLKSMKANFAIHITGGKVKDSKKGNVSLKGEKYHVLLGGQEIICDTKTVWTYNKEAKEVQVTNYNPSEQSISPAKLLSGSYEKEYRYNYKGEKKDGAKNCDVVELLPKESSSKVSRIELLVDKAVSMVVSGNIWEKNGNKIQYTISNFTPNAPVPDSYFTWVAKDHLGVEVVDLR